MEKLTERQQKILAAMIEEYAEVASPVGSVTLAKLFKVSSATIRNEMATLERQGYIKQPHTSAGRTPTDKGYRFYVNDLNSSSTPPANSTVDRNARAINTRLNNAGEHEQTVRLAVKTLVELTGNVGLATIGDSLYVRGFASLFSQPELMQADAARNVAILLDNLEPWLREAAPNKPLSVFIGRENPIGKSSQSSLIISKFRSPYSDRSYIGVVGPTRQNYRLTMGLVSHTGRTLESLMKKV